MRRLMLAIAVTVALALSVAAPAVAAPERNPLQLHFTVTCGSNPPVETIGVSQPGFELEGPAGTTGIFFGGTLTVYDSGGQVVEGEGFSVAPPPGLADKLQTCTLVRYLDDGGSRVWDPAYIMLTPNDSR
jgi:hypothetical protein